MSYKAIVVRVFTRPLPGADKLLIGSCGSYQVIVGIGVQDGQLGLFFEQDGQLSEEFCQKNDLIRRKNEDGTPAGGMFEPNRRVKAIKLRGARSEGFWCQLDNLSYAGNVSKLKEGDQIDSLNGHAICNKYFTPATQRSGKARHKAQKDNPMFHKHVDTGMFKRESQTIPVGSLVYVTEKLHGTSGRLAHVLDEQTIQRSWFFNLIATAFGWPKTRKVWTHLIGSRNVILEHREGSGFYGEEQFRQTVVAGISLHRGECLYGEIVGFTETGSSIMATQNIGQLKDKRLKERFGETITYSYGCMPGTCKFYVYRITQVNEDGIQVDLSWNQVKKRSKELGLPIVPELGFQIHSGDLQSLSTFVADFTESTETELPYESVLDSRHIREGVVVRFESEHGTGWLKSKSFCFGVLEGYLKESDEYVDTEESA